MTTVSRDPIRVLIVDDHTVVRIGLRSLLSHSAGFRVVGEPKRWIPELDLVLILAAVETLRRVWRMERRRTAVRTA